MACRMPADQAETHVDDGITLPDVRQELVTQTLALTGTLDNTCSYRKTRLNNIIDSRLILGSQSTCNIDELHCSWDGFHRTVYLRKYGESAVRNRNNARIWLDSTERKVCSFGRNFLEQGVEQG